MICGAMSTRLLAVLGGLVVVVGGAFALVTTNRPAPAPAPDTAAARSAPVTPAAAPVPAPAPPPSARDDAPAAAAPRRPAAPAPAPAETAPMVTNATSLEITADVPGAQVFVDRRFIGEAPVTTAEFAPGAHTITISAQGFEGVSRTVNVTSGLQQVAIKLREVRLNAKLDVVHKHRMGSCTGTLTATPQGLRYDSSDKDDAFTTALLDLEAFEVDYLKKNLKIKLKKGKSFDFTDPAGNADPLFVFHRDVDKARVRLQKGDPPAAE
jgi:hypothetical protein